MAVQKRTKNGKIVTFLNPAEKSRKFVKELRTGNRITNDGSPKKTESGKTMKVSVKGRAYRAGYLDARNDNAKAFKSNAKK